jgi:hypothetical protein
MTDVRKGERNLRESASSGWATLEPSMATGRAAVCAYRIGAGQWASRRSVAADIAAVTRALS